MMNRQVLRKIMAPPNRRRDLTFLVMALIILLAICVTLRVLRLIAGDGWRVQSPTIGTPYPLLGDGAPVIWRPMQGPSGGKVNALLINGQNPSMIYAGTDGGVYTSRDGGVTWQRTSEGLPADQEIRTLAMAQVSPAMDSATAQPPALGTPYPLLGVGTPYPLLREGMAQGLPALYAGTYVGVYRSIDGGQTWLLAKADLMGRPILSLAVDPSNTAVVYAGTDGQVFRSLDGGDEWEESSEGMPLETVWSLAVDPTRSSTLYAGTDSGIFTSADSGRQWQRAGGNIRYSVPPLGGPDRLRVQALVIDPVHSNTLYAATEGGVYRSADAGATWQPARGGLGNNIVHALVIDPNNTDILYAAVGTQGVWQSNNRGATWEPVGGNTQGLAEGDGCGGLVLTLAINPAHSRVIYAGTGRGVCYSNSAGQRWEARNEGLRNTNVLSLVGIPKRPGSLFTTTGLDVYRTLDDGQTWSSINDGFAHPNVLALAVNPLSPDTLYAGTWYSEIYRSLDGGRTWRLVNGGLARNAPVSALVVQCAVEVPSGQACEVLYAATNGAGVFFSPDDGIQWTAVNNGLGDLRVQVLAPSPDGAALYAGTSEGVYRLRFSAAPSASPDPQEGVRSTYIQDAAAWVWEAVWQGLPRDEVHSLVVDERSPNLVYAATATGLGEMYRSVDGGDNWTTIGRGSLPTNITIQTVVLRASRGKPSVLYVGTDGGIFRSGDGGQNWRAINDGLPSGANVLAMLIDANRSYLYASIKNNGIYQSVDPISGEGLIPLPLAVGAALALIALATGAFLWARWFLHSSKQAQDQVFERNWPTWREEIRGTLQEKNVVKMDALADIPPAFRLRSLQQYVQEYGDDGLVVRLNPPTLGPVNASQVGDFLRNWRAARKRMGSAATFRPAVSRITEQLCQLLGFTLLETRSYKHLHGYMVKAPALRLKMPPMFPIVFLQSPPPRDAVASDEPTTPLGLRPPGRMANSGRRGQPATEMAEGDFRDLRDLMGILNASSYLALLVIPGDAKAGDGRQRQWDAVARSAQMKANLRKLVAGTAYDFVIIDFNDLYRIFVAKNPEKTFVRILLEQVDLTVVSPYVTSGPVPENMFFGRDHELKTISRTIKDNSFAIVGGRKIGKTSILSKLQRAFTDNPDYQSLFLDCQAVQNYDDFCNAVETMWQVTLSNHAPEDVQRLIARMRQEREGQLVVILLDEVDALLKYDAGNGERLFKVFRALSQEAYCRFIFCGGKALHVRLHDPDAALFNFCNIIPLSYLTARDTGRIVLEPMQEMGIGFEDATRLVEGIMSLSSCHPNVVQYICQELIVRINTRGDRFITQADLDAIANSSRLGEYMIEVMWGNTNALERLITLLIILERPSATLAQIEAVLHARGVDAPTAAVEEALDTLVLYSVLSKEDGGYSFTAAEFPSVVAATQDVDLLVERAIHQGLSRETTAPPN